MNLGDIIPPERGSTDQVTFGEVIHRLTVAMEEMQEQCNQMLAIIAGHEAEIKALKMRVAHLDARTPTPKKSLIHVTDQAWRN